MQDKTSFQNYIRKEATRNFACTLMFWVITSANYFLIEFELKYLNGGIFRDSMTSSLAEVAGCFLGGILMMDATSTLRIKSASFVVNILPMIGAIGILVCQSLDNANLTAAFVLLANLGIGSSYVVQSSITVLLFANNFQIEVFSVCNFVAIAVSALSPLCIELMRQPLPLYLMIGTSSLGTFISLFGFKLKGISRDSSLKSVKPDKGEGKDFDEQNMYFSQVSKEKDLQLI